MLTQQQSGDLSSYIRKSKVSALAEKITPQLMRASVQARNLNIAPPEQIETTDKLRRRYVEIHGFDKYTQDILGSSTANARFYECLVRLPGGEKTVVTGDGVERVVELLQRLSGGDPDQLPYFIKVAVQRRQDGKIEWTKWLSM